VPDVQTEDYGGRGELTSISPDYTRARELYLSVGGVLDNLEEEDREFIRNVLSVDDRLALQNEIQDNGDGNGNGNGHDGFPDDLISRAHFLHSHGATIPEEVMQDPDRLRDAVDRICKDPEFIRIQQEDSELEALSRKVMDSGSTLVTRITNPKTGATVCFLNHAKIAEYLAVYYRTISFNDVIYVYSDGIYQPNAKELEKKIRQIIEIGDVKCSITKETRDIMKFVSTHNLFRDFPFNQYKDVIPVRNGVLRIDYHNETITLEEFSPKYRFTWRLPVEYDPSATGDLFHELVISQYVEREVVDLLYQIPAQALLQAQGSKPYKKAYILQGDQDAGKTTYLEWLIDLFGHINISHASLHQIGLDKFINAVIEGKILNTFDDLSDIPLENVGPFKYLTGGYSHQVERKHQTPYQSLITAVHVFSCNAPPEVPEKILFDPAFWSRWEYIHFPNVFEIDPAFKEKFFTRDNLSGAFNRILQMMIQIKKKGLVIEHSPSEVKDEWQISSDPFAKLCRDHMVSTTMEHNFGKEHLLNAFREYCHENQVNDRKIPSTIKGLSTIAFKNGFKETQRGKNRERVYTAHLDWKSGSKYRPTKEVESDAGENKTL
jgi:phage/plasmid-associated DNA primase